MAKGSPVSVSSIIVTPTLATILHTAPLTAIVLKTVFDNKHFINTHFLLFQITKGIYQMFLGKHCEVWRIKLSTEDILVKLPKLLLDFPLRSVWIYMNIYLSQKPYHTCCTRCMALSNRHQEVHVFWLKYVQYLFSKLVQFYSFFLCLINPSFN